MPAPALRELSPMLLTEVARPFTREGWTFELKYDGWRCLAEIRDGALHLQSRRGFDFTRRWPAVMQSLSAIPGITFLTAKCASSMSWAEATSIACTCARAGRRTAYLIFWFTMA